MKRTLKNRDGHQFHQYQQNEHKKTMIFDVGNSGSVLGQAQKDGGVKPVDGIPIVPS
jgi:hypothetical protein